MTSQLRPELAAAAPRLIVFDKGGTLVDFRRMWTDWAIEMARRLEAATGLALAERFFCTIEFDPHSGDIAHDGPFATATMAELRDLTAELLCQAGLPRPACQASVTGAWFAPDPVRQARPLADLPALFGGLRAAGLHIAVATVDDRAPSEATFAAWGILDYVDALLGGDDGVPLKPAPDMVWALCRATGVDPARTVVVGDAVTDLQMGRAAGAALSVAVLTGVAPREVLAPHADLVLASVADLLTPPTDHDGAV
jgi:phosphoglycolate phosphatase